MQATGGGSSPSRATGGGADDDGSGGNPDAAAGVRMEQMSQLWDTLDVPVQDRLDALVAVLDAAPMSKEMFGRFSECQGRLKLRHSLRAMLAREAALTGHIKMVKSIMDQRYVCRVCVSCVHVSCVCPCSVLLTDSLCLPPLVSTSHLLPLLHSGGMSPDPRALAQMKMHSDELVSLRSRIMESRAQYVDEFGERFSDPGAYYYTNPNANPNHNHNHCNRTDRHCPLLCQPCSL